jgi:hypothetical protein
MKKLLLLSALLIFACSSDDSSDNNDDSNQTFLEKYDGVFWKEIDNEQDFASDYEYWLIFNQNSSYDCESFESNCNCATPFNWGEEDEEGNSYVISEDSPERLVVLVTEVDNFQTYQYTISIDAINNGTRIEVRISDGDSNEVEYYDRVSEQPCN